MSNEDIETLGIDRPSQAKLKLHLRKIRPSEVKEEPPLKYTKFEPKEEKPIPKLKSWDLKFNAQELKEHLLKISNKMDEESVLALLNEKTRLYSHCETQKLQQRFISNTTISFFQALK